MVLKLCNEGRAQLDGARGPAAQMAIRIIVRVAEGLGGEALVDITGAHIRMRLFQGESAPGLAEGMASLGAKVVVGTTLNVSGVDEHGWREWATPPEWAEKARRQMIAYQSMGAAPTWTCAPYQTEWRPKFGQQIAWGESNAI